MASPLEIASEQTRNEALARNVYSSDANGYSSNNKNALSDGDDKGKGELNNSIGSKTDILTRIDNTGRNIYNSNNQYGLNNPNALSDGDDKGKGELNNSIGDKIDILTRIDNTGRNIYGSNKSYPDFPI